MDVVSREVRSRMMAGIKAKDTGPEMLVRKLLTRMGFRYRLHVPNLAGKPDIVLRKYKTVIFINGCFWHGHEQCNLFRLPKSRTAFWEDKIGGNIARDNKKHALLIEQGWQVIILWECSIKGKTKQEPPEIANRLLQLLEFPHNQLVHIRGAITDPGK